MHHLPIFHCRLVREGSQPSATKRIRCAADANEILQEYLRDQDRENFVVLLLDTQNQVRGIHTVTVGILDASLVHPREVFKPAILASAASLILAHNHPSGDPTPSAEDRSITRQLQAAAVILGFTILDHIIVGDDNSFYSFAESCTL